MERLPDETTAAPPATAAPLASPAPTPTTHVVAAGDHFWAIASSTLTEFWGRAPTEAETVPYWEHLVAANRGVLSDPGNADLLFPGQELTLPTPPPSPSSSPSPSG
jgi:nucleoid-associated protein YgaU